MGVSNSQSSNEKSVMKKDRTKKTAPEMDFDEFITWATGYILFGIGEGQKLRDVVWFVCNQAAQNKVWGGQKSNPAKQTELLNTCVELKEKVTELLNEQDMTWHDLPSSYDVDDVINKNTR